jgi:cell division septum initiation protein DivIVA
MPVLTQQQKEFYENTRGVTRQEIEDLKDQIEEELSKVKQRIADLQEALNAAKQMYEAACNRLGVPNDLDEGDEGE